MRSINWLGFFCAMRPGTTPSATAREPGRIARIIELQSRGGIPVDGMMEKKPAPERRPEPVRWGNFR